MTTHADLLAAIDKAQNACDHWGPQSDHLDTLRAILRLHDQCHSFGGAEVPPFDYCGGCDGEWPCDTVQVVADALTRMGAL